MSIYDYLGEGCNGSMFLSPVDEQEIIRTVQQFILPVYKGWDKCVFTNYISLLPQFSKIQEKIYNARLENFLNRYDLFCQTNMGLYLTRFNKIVIPNNKVSLNHGQIKI